MNWLTSLGIGLTVVWLGSFALVLYFQSSDGMRMSLNEWGDFLAGASAPLALLWLVVGYFQHGKELRLNTEALRLQQDELERQANETRRLARAADRQAIATEEQTRQHARDARRERIRRRS